MNFQTHDMLQSPVCVVFHRWDDRCLFSVQSPAQSLPDLLSRHLQTHHSYHRIIYNSKYDDCYDVVIVILLLLYFKDCILSFFAIVVFYFLPLCLLLLLLVLL